MALATEDTRPVFPHLRPHPVEAGVLGVGWFTRVSADEVAAHVGLA